MGSFPSPILAYSLRQVEKKRSSNTFHRCRSLKASPLHLYHLHIYRSNVGCATLDDRGMLGASISRGSSRLLPLFCTASQYTTSAVTTADVVVVGAGHNGLVAATLLARQGLKVPGLAWCSSKMCLRLIWCSGLILERSVGLGCPQDVLHRWRPSPVNQQFSVQVALAF
jgi:hypothetical protein